MLVTSSGVKTAVVGAAEVTGAGGVGEPAVVTVTGAGGVGEPAVVIGVVMMIGSGGVGIDEDMIEPESLGNRDVATASLHRGRGPSGTHAAVWGLVWLRGGLRRPPHR